MAVSTRVSSSGAIRRACLAVAAGALLLVSLPTPVGAAEDPIATGCRQAERLLALDRPQVAITMIEGLRKARPAASGQAPACDTAYAAAVSRQVAAQVVAQRAAEQKADDEDEARRLAEQAVGLDRDNADALELLADLDAADEEAEATTWPEQTATSWTDLREEQLEPWLVVLRDLLLWVAAGLLGARLVRIPLRNHATRWRALRDERWPRRVGLATIWVGALLGVVVTAGPGWLVAWVGLTAAGAVLLAAAWNAGRRLEITCPESSSLTSEHIHSLIRLLAPGVPLGVERPSGIDSKTLEEVGITTTSAVPWMAALARVAALARPPSPWLLVVAAHGDGALATRLTRNGELVSNAVIDPAEVRRVAGVADDATTTFELAVFPAAQAVMRIVTAYGDRTGLAGATGWLSLAYQHLAATLPRTSPHAQALAAQAVALDPANRLARLGYWQTLYREARTPEDLARYDALLRGLDPADNPADNPADADKSKSATGADRGLRLRVLHTRLAVGINRLSAAGEPVRGDPQLVAIADQLCPLVDELWREERDQRRLGVLHETVLTHLRRSVAALVESVTDPDWTGPPPLPTRTPESLGPAVNYSLACALATTGPRRAQDRAARAVPHLRLADVDPVLEAWRDRDPQLAGIRGTEAYRRAFGPARPTDLLAVAPYAAHAARLRSVGLVGVETLAEARPAEFAGLELPAAEVRWLVALARCCRTLATRDATWAVAVTEVLAREGVRELPLRGRRLEAVAATVHRALSRHSDAPRKAQVVHWLR